MTEQERGIHVHGRRQSLRTFWENCRGMGIGCTSVGRTGLKYFLFLYLSAIQTSITARDAFSSGTWNPAGRLPSQIARARALPTVFIVCKGASAPGVSTETSACGALSLARRAAG